MIHEGMNQQEFSRATGIAPASLSSIFTGRTSPTLKHAEALHRSFPYLNMSWLLFGDGEMMVSNDLETPSGADVDSSAGNNPAGQDDFFGPHSTPISASQSPNDFSEANLGASGYAQNDINNPSKFAPQIPLEILKNLNTKPRRIAEIRIFFDDGTFEVFKGNI